VVGRVPSPVVISCSAVDRVRQRVCAGDCVRARDEKPDICWEKMVSGFSLRANATDSVPIKSFEWDVG